MPSTVPKHNHSMSFTNTTALRSHTAASHTSPSNPAQPSFTTRYPTLSRNQPSTSKSATRPRTKASNQRSIFSDSDSELSPPSSEEDDGEAEADENEQYEEVVTPRKGQHKGRVAQNNVANVENSGKKKTASQNKKGKKVVGKKKSHPVEAVTKTTTTGPAGREKKRFTKLEDAERRRARDAKFDVDDDFGNTVSINWKTKSALTDDHRPPRRPSTTAVQFPQKIRHRLMVMMNPIGAN